MGILQRAYETYEHYPEYAREDIKGSQMAPVAHMVTTAQIEIIIDQDGIYQSGRCLDEKEAKIIIPVTEDSFGRTSSPCPHPLCDQLKYLAPYDEEKHNMYLVQLRQWLESEYRHPKLRPIYRYVEGGTILRDLSEEGIIQLTKEGIPEKEKQMVCWRVIGTEEAEEFSTACWLDQTLIQCFIAYYQASQTGAERGICMVTGETAVLAKQHPKGVVSLHGNAKLISANDKSGFTYRGRFSEEWQAATVSFEVSQKAHNALRWILEEQGVRFGKRTFVCWNPRGKKVMIPSNTFLAGQDVYISKPTDYRQKLRDTLIGFRKENQLTGKETAVIAVFDAATAGRLAMTYYNELSMDAYLARLHDWDASCYWENWEKGIQSPPLSLIVHCAYGTEREEKGGSRMVADERVLQQQMQRLLACRLRGGKMPVDIVKTLTVRASNPQAYEKNCWRQILFVACAVIRKSKSDRYKEEWNVALDENNKNRSYLFGRMLAVFERVEEEACRNGRLISAEKQEGGNIGKETKSTNASRMQSVYSKKPLATWKILEGKLEPYYRRLRADRVSYYKNLVGSIAAFLDEKDPGLNQSLEDVYLLGYYHQRQAFFAGKKQAGNTEENITGEE